MLGGAEEAAAAAGSAATAGMEQPWAVSSSRARFLLRQRMVGPAEVLGGVEDAAVVAMAAAAVTDGTAAGYVVGAGPPPFSPCGVSATELLGLTPWAGLDTGWQPG